MNCEQARTSLTDYLMEEVTPAEKLEIRQHADACASCAEELERLKHTLTLLASAEVPEEIPQRMRLAAEPVGFWSAFWRNGARLTFAGAGLACLAVGLLAVSQARITGGGGSWEIAFGTPSSGTERVQGEASVVQSTAGALGRDEIAKLIDEAVRASEARQASSIEAHVQAIAQQSEQQRLRDLNELSESFRYIQAAQTMMWKDQVQNQEVMGALARQVGLPGARP